MARVTVEDCLEKVDNRFALVILAAQRAKQLLAGSKSLISDSENKQVVSALREIADGKVRFMTEEDIQKRREKEQKERELALANAKANAEHSTNGNSTNGNSSNGAPTNGNGAIATKATPAILADSEEGFDEVENSDE